jgi:four helix bundle protein
MGMTSFKQMTTWQKAFDLTILIYEITKPFPNNELFGITNQLRRASVSISSNIAEGFGKRSYKDKLNFYYISLGSLNEVINLVEISFTLNYIDKQIYDQTSEDIVNLHKLINGLIVKTRTFIRQSGVV